MPPPPVDFSRFRPPRLAAAGLFALSLASGSLPLSLGEVIGALRESEPSLAP